MRSVLVLVGWSLTAFAQPAPRAAPTCGAPCKDAERYLGGKEWNYRKAVAIYRAQCKADYSGPADACRLYALAGYETRGETLKTPVVLKILESACKRGDVAACGWQIRIASRDKPDDQAPKWTAYEPLEAPCQAGDRAACKPFFTAMRDAISPRQCEGKWRPVAEAACKLGSVQACVVVLKMHRSRHCDEPRMTKDQAGAELDKACSAGDIDACIEVHNDDALWKARCKAGEQFACDAFK